MQETQQAVCRVRQFTRFYMSSLSLLGNRYLGSAYSATEARVLFELHEHTGANAAFIVKKLHLDKSYLSRILSKFEKNGMLRRETSQSDARSSQLYLTEHGAAVTEALIQASNQQIGAQLQSLTAEDCRALIQALDTVTAILTPKEVPYENRSL